MSRNREHWYQAFGMRIRSEFVLPELESAGPGAADVWIRRHAVDRAPPPPGVLRTIDVGDDEIYLGFHSIGKYLIHGSFVVDVDLTDGFSEDLVGFTLLGPVMALLLHRRGLFTLHGGAAIVNGGAAIFVGDKGAGKSTTIGAMVAAGYDILTDDIVAISDSGSAPRIVPAYPMIKLTDAAISAFGQEHFALIPTNVPDFDKRRVRLADMPSTEPAEPRAIYVLETSDTPGVEPLDRLQSYQALLRFSYATRFGQKLIQGAAAAEHMRHCAALSANVPVYRLRPPRDLTRLAEFIDSVVRSQ